MAVVYESRIPDIVERAETDAKESVEKRTAAVEVGARLNLVVQGSVVDGGLLASGDEDVEGFIGSITFGRGLPDARSVYIELGTGERGAGYEFPGKPDGITYDMSWTRGIPKDPAHGFAYLIPALEAEREPFDEDAAGWYR